MSYFSVKDNKKKRTYGGGKSSYGAPTYMKDVLEKLRNHEDYKSHSEEDLLQKAKELTDVGELQSEFSHLTSLPFERYAEEIAEESEVSLVHSKEVLQAKSRAVSRLRPPSIVLYLFELKRPTSRFFSRFSRLLALKYGPLHAAIQIEDVVIQWSTTSLVIPERYNPADPVFRTDLKNKTTVSSFAKDLCPKVVDALERKDFNQQIDLQFDLAVNVEELIDKVKKVIVKYNKYRYYSVMYCNCQTFVEDVMKEIGIKNAPHSLSGRLNDYFKKLTAAKLKGTPEFPTHESLDMYIEEQDLGAMQQHDKEYFLCLYFQFHLEAMKAGQDPSEIECRVHGCLMESLERSLTDIKMFLESYVTEHGISGV